MKLAEALRERADLQKQLHDLEQRLQHNAQHQEGEQPAELPDDLLQQYHAVAQALRNLIVAINRRNQNIYWEDGSGMIEALAERDLLQAEHRMLSRLAQAAIPEQGRYSRSEIKILAAVDVKKIRQRADDVAKRLRLLDSKIQQANWTHDL